MFSFRYCCLFFISFQLFTGSCSTQSPTRIQGKISLHAGWKPVVYLVQPASLSTIAANFSGQVVDSVQITQDGHFSIPWPAQKGAATAGLFQLTVQPASSRYPTRLSDQNPAESNYMPVVWKPGQTLDIEADITHFQQSFSMKSPTPENGALLHLRDIRQQAFAAHAAILSSQKHDENTLLGYEDAVLHFREALMAFADSTQALLPALVAIRWVSPENDYERVPEFLSRQAKKWQQKAPAQPFVQQLSTLTDSGKLPLQVGQFMPDFALPMVSGDTISLKNLLGKRLTIVDLWASWCGPCRRENRETLVPLWQQYRDRGLQIIGYSIDSSPAAWKAAIAKDGAGWPQASHLSGDVTPFMEALKISTIPANFILDAEGKVLAKNVHGQALGRWVEGYFK